MEFIHRSPASRKSKNGRAVPVPVIKVAKFSATSCAEPNQPRSPQVEVKTSPTHKPRWGNRVSDAETIASKAWYMRSFEEVVEIECGEELRDERYGHYNKSFVTKKNCSPKKPVYVFGSVVNDISSIPPRKVGSSSSKEVKKSINKQGDTRKKSTTKIDAASLSTNSKDEVSPHLLIEESIISRRLPAKTLSLEINHVDKRTECVLKSISKNIDDTMKLKQAVEDSAMEVLELHNRSTRAIGISKSGLQSLLSNGNARSKDAEERMIKDWEQTYLQTFRKKDIKQMEMLVDDFVSQG